MTSWLGTSPASPQESRPDGARRVLVVPPDHTRLHSRGGKIAAHLDRTLRALGVTVDVMPGREAALQAMADDPDLAGDVAAASHLIHGSTDGRFTVRYSPGPGLSRVDIEGVGYEYTPPDEVNARLGSRSGFDSDGRPFVTIANAGLGLWREGVPSIVDTAS